MDASAGPASPPQTAPGPERGSRRHTTLTAWAFLTPALILLGISVLVPAVLALLMSFSRTGLDVSEPLQFVGLSNLRRLVADPMLRRVALTTALYLVGVGLALLVQRPSAQAA